MVGAAGTFVAVGPGAGAVAVTTTGSVAAGSTGDGEAAGDVGVTEGRATGKAQAAEIRKTTNRAAHTGKNILGREAVFIHYPFLWIYIANIGQVTRELGLVVFNLVWNRK